MASRVTNLGRDGSRGNGTKFQLMLRGFVPHDDESAANDARGSENQVVGG